MDIYFYVLMYIQDEYRRLGVFLFVLLFTVTVISYFLLRDVLLRLRVAEEFLFISARRHAYIIIKAFHSLLIIILLSQPP